MKKKYPRTLKNRSFWSHVNPFRFCNNNNKIGSKLERKRMFSYIDFKQCDPGYLIISIFGHLEQWTFALKY